jgi:hypothetical protein
MTLTIRNIKTNEVFEYHYQDAVIDGNVVYLGRQKTAGGQRVWNREDIDIQATEGDHIFIRDANTGELRQIR